MSSNKETGVVSIHGKDYKTVAKRVDEFRKQYESKMAIVTNLVAIDEKSVVMKAEILDENQRIIATGYAEENRQASQINRTSALENCETSAIGRALANFGLAGGEYASADEVASAINQQEQSNKSRIDFQEVRDTAKMIDDLESLQALYKELMAEKLTEKQQAVINRIISERKKELEK